MGWRGVDLDGTLAEYDGWVSETHIGEPIPRMVDRVRKWLKDGEEGRIFTARISCQDPEPIIEAIQTWCKEHIGQALFVTNMKDWSMSEFWDDRCVQVIPNTGKRADGQE